jgi:hypothetical protein
MALESHLEELSEKHRKLEVVIEQEEQHANLDSLRITDLKRQKLKLKDEINKMKKSLH